MKKVLKLVVAIVLAILILGVLCIIDHINYLFRDYAVIEYRRKLAVKGYNDYIISVNKHVNDVLGALFVVKLYGFCLAGFHIYNSEKVLI